MGRIVNITGPYTTSNVPAHCVIGDDGTGRQATCVSIDSVMPESTETTAPQLEPKALYVCVPLTFWDRVLIMLGFTPRIGIKIFYLKHAVSRIDLFVGGKQALV